MPNALTRWWHQPDHYYWMTAYLAARGSQAAVCRSIALIIIGMAVVPMLLLITPAGPQSDVNRAVTLAVSVCCLALAVLWLRPTWPSQRASMTFVVVAGFCVAASAIVGGNPVGNVTACAAFAFLGAYTGVFHTGRVVFYNLVVSALAVAITSIGVAQVYGVVYALCVGPFIITLNIGVSMACQMLVHMQEVTVLADDIDELTGLLNKDAFYEQASALIGARNRKNDQYLVIAVTTLDHYRVLAETDGRVATDRARVAVGQTLRDVTRQNAVVAHVGEEEFFIADTFQTTDVSPLVNRVSSAIASTPPRLTASIGVVSTPLRGLTDVSSQDVLDELVTIATVAMFDARLAGGNQVRHVECPPLRVLDDRPDN